MKLIDRYKYSCMPNLDLPTQELQGEQRQLRRNLNSRAISLASSAAQLAGVNALTLLVMHSGLNWLPQHCGGVVGLLAPYVGCGYSLRLLKTLGMGSVAAYPLGVAHDAIKDVVGARAAAIKAKSQLLED